MNDVRLQPSTITVRRAPNLGGRPPGTRGVLRLGPLALPCALGRAGLRSLKREGDGATPIGAFAVLRVLRRRDRPLAGLPLAVPQGRIARTDGWSDDPRDPAYNRPVRLPRRWRAETLWRDDRLYDAIVVLDYNVRCRSRWRGSAVFWHVARDGLEPTEGCVALAPADMRLVLPHLRAGQRVVVA